MKRLKNHFFKATKFTAYWLSIVIFMSTMWVNRKFGDPSFEQILYHLQFGSDGLIEADSALIKSYVTNCLVSPIGIAFVLYLYEHFIISVSKIGLRTNIQKLKENLFWLIKPVFLAIYKISFFILSKHLPVLLLITSSIFFLTKFAFWEFINNLRTSEFIGQNYIKPDSVVSPKHKRNLVLIYVESLENTYSNKKIFQEDLLSSLNKKTEKFMTFDNYRQTAGTGWTIAGIVSTQCGIPLRAMMRDGNKFGESVKQFLPNAVCLGDILKNAGYKNIFIEGASLSFAGKGIFLKDHGYSEVYGLEEWKNEGFNKFNGWGLYDDELFEVAKHNLAELEKSNAPYNLTILTLDTHHPEGFINQTCARKGVKEFTGIVKCTSDILSDFISFMEHKGYLKNTNVVILGDHLAMVNTVHKQLSKEKNRTIYNKFITKEPMKKNRNMVYHYDMFPTILYTMGFRFDNNRLGLGASGVGNIDPKYGISSMDYHVLNKELSQQSLKYLDFWKTKK